MRKLRATGAPGNAALIKTLEAESRSKWEELRSLRADPERQRTALPEASEAFIADTTTIVAGNLAHDVTEQDLRELIIPLCEIVSLKLMTDRRGRPKGIATIKLRTDQPDPLIEQLGRAELRGRVLDVWLDRPSASFQPGRRGKRPRR